MWACVIASPTLETQLRFICHLKVHGIIEGVGRVALWEAILIEQVRIPFFNFFQFPSTHPFFPFLTDMFKKAFCALKNLFMN